HEEQTCTDLRTARMIECCGGDRVPWSTRYRPFQLHQDRSARAGKVQASSFLPVGPFVLVEFESLMIRAGELGRREGDGPGLPGDGLLKIPGFGIGRLQATELL